MLVIPWPTALSMFATVSPRTEFSVEEEVAQLVFATRDVREVGWVAELFAEEGPSSEVGGVGFACLPGVGCDGDLESSAEVKIEACLDGR